MDRGSTAFGVAAVAAALALLPLSARAADIEQGHALARQWCAACHAVEPGAKTTSDIPPSFVSIARRKDVTASSLRAWLNAPHPNMPNFELSRAAIDDLIAYIRSQK